MSSEISPRLLSFLGGEFARQHHQTVVKIELLHCPPAGYRPDPIGTWTPDDGKSAELFSNRGHVFVERLVGEIIELAEGHADSYGVGRHRFQIRATQSLGGRQLHAFVIQPSFDGDDQALVQAQLADPSQGNLVGQLMRHLENRDRQAQQERSSYLQAMGHHAAALRDENLALREMLAARDSERLESMKIVEEAKSEEHKRQIEALVVTGENERKNLAVKKVMGLLPVAVSQALSHLAKSSKEERDGEPSKKPEASPLSKLALRLMQSLKTSQRELIEDTLGLEQRIMLAEVARVSSEGGSLVLPALLHELGASLVQKQAIAIMTCMDEEQRQMFAQVLQIASAQAAPAPDPEVTTPGTPPSSAGGAGGTVNGTEPDADDAETEVSS